jgi:hypothetical protein
LTRKPAELQPEIPKNQRDALILRAKARAAARMEMEDKLRRHHRI